MVMEISNENLGSTKTISLPFALQRQPQRPQGGNCMTKRKMRAASESVRPKPLPSIPPYGDFAVDVENLTFGYSNTSFSGLSKTGDNLILNNLDLKLPTGSRCLLIGANGQ